MCLKYIPNTTRGMKPRITHLINEMEMKNAAYAADLFAIEKNGLNQAFKIRQLHMDCYKTYVMLHIVWFNFLKAVKTSRL